MKRSTVISVNELLACLIFLFGFLYMGFTIYYNEYILRILSYCILICGYFLYFIYLFTVKGDIKASVTSIVFLIYCIFLWVLNYFNYQVLILCLTFFLTFSSFDIVKIVPKTERILKFLVILCLMQVFVLVITYFSPYAYYSLFSNYSSRDLLLGFPNPNETGMILTYTAIPIVLLMKISNKKCIRIIATTLFVAIVYFLVLTRARTAFFGLLLFLIMVFNKKIADKCIFSSTKSIWLFITLPILFVPAYLTISKAYSNITFFFGKTLFSGRQIVYNSYIENWTSKMFGNISIFHLTNAHNGFLSIIVNFGLIGMALYLFHMVVNLKALKSKCNNKVARIGFIAILCILLMSCTEAAFLTGSKYFYSNFLMVCWLSDYYGDYYEKNSINN